MGSNPPEWHLGPQRPRPRTLWSDLGGLWARFRGLPILAQAVLFLAVAVIVVILISIFFAGDGDGTNVASRSTTTRPDATLAPTTTSTVVLPAGDDRTVKSVLDGDSFELTDGTKIRLLGLDAPDVETSDCFSAEATQHLRGLLPAGTNVRIVYDTTRTDRIGRTLAYAYRLPDGLFVNVAVVFDGFARQLPVPPNIRHANDIEGAENAARAAARGLWQTCGTTTTARPVLTTSPATTVATVTTSTTVASTTSTTVGTTTSSVAGATTTTAAAGTSG